MPDTIVVEGARRQKTVSEATRDTESRLLNIWEERQMRRFEDLIDFAKSLRQPETLKAVREDPEFFNAMLYLALEEYNIQKSVLANRIEMSAAAITRWLTGENTAKGAQRRDCLEQIADILDELIAKYEADKARETYRFAPGIYRKPD